MQLISLNVGTPQEKLWMEKPVLTSIFKKPVTNQRKVSFLNIEGDEQSDLRVHGGVDKAVYAYDVSHYDHWKTVLPREDWSFGLFGENLTTSGLPDDEVRIGNIYQAGTAKLQVIQPRFPCVKINIRFGLPDMIERFMEQKRSGIYFRVVEEGAIQVNNAISLVETSPYPVTVQDYTDCYYSKGANREVLHTLLSIPYLPRRQRLAFESFL
jgi:MOSC domain-containing protein YiiM